MNTRALTKWFDRFLLVTSGPRGRLERAVRRGFTARRARRRRRRAPTTLRAPPVPPRSLTASRSPDSGGSRELSPSSAPPTPTARPGRISTRAARKTLAPLPARRPRPLANLSAGHTASLASRLNSARWSITARQGLKDRSAAHPTPTRPSVRTGPLTARYVACISVRKGRTCGENKLERPGRGGQSLD